MPKLRPLAAILILAAVFLLGAFLAKANLELIKSRLELSNFSEISQFSDQQIKQVLEKEIDSKNAPDLTYGVYILSILQEMDFIEWISTGQYKDEFYEEFNQIVDEKTNLRALYISTGQKIVFKVIGAIQGGVAEKASGVPLNSIGLTSKVIDIGRVVFKIGQMKMYDGMWRYFDERKHNVSHQEAWEWAKVQMGWTDESQSVQRYYLGRKIDAGVTQLEPEFQSLWDQWGKYLSAGGINKTAKDQVKKELRDVLLEVLKKEAQQPQKLSFWQRLKNQVENLIRGSYSIIPKASEALKRIQSFISQINPFSPAGITEQAIKGRPFEHVLEPSAQERDSQGQPLPQKEEITPEIEVQTTELGAAPTELGAAPEERGQPPILEPPILEEPEPVSQIPPAPPAGLPFFAGGGPSPASTSDTASPEAPIITSHNSGAILGLSDDSTTSTDGFQINLAGTAEAGANILISVNPTYTTSTNSQGNWQKEITLEQGANEIKVKAQDPAQNQSQAATLSLTVDTTPPSTIIDLSASPGTNRGEISFSWTAPGDDESIGTTTQYILRYAISTISTSTWALAADVNNEPTPTLASTTQSATISGLTPGQTYYFAIKSQDKAANFSEISNSAFSVPQAQAEHLVISELAAKGPNGATDEFIELYNPTNSSINLAGFSLQYGSAQATSTWTYKYFQVNGQSSQDLPNINLASHSFYLLTSATSSNYYSYGMSPDLVVVTTSNNPTYLGLDDSGGKVRLLDGNDQVIDLAAWGQDSLGAEGIPIDVSGFSWGSLERKAKATSTPGLLAVNSSHHWLGNNQDIDNNSQDFVLQTSPNPQNSLSLKEPETSFPVLAASAWPMLQHNVRHTGLSPYSGTATGAPTSTPKWTVSLGSGNPTSPVISSDGSIFIGAASGKIYKVSSTGAKELFYDTQTTGTVETPALGSDGAIYFSDSFALYAISSAGQLKWKYSVSDASSPTIGSDGTIYFGSEYEFYALNPNGEKIWQSSQLSNGRWVRSSALSADGTIYTAAKVGSDAGNRNVYALSPGDGSILWKSASSTFSTAPALESDGTIFVSGVYGLYALNSSDGGQKWFTAIGNISNSAPAIGQDTIYIGAENYTLYAINKTDGSAKWSFVAGAQIRTSPIIDNQGVIYVGSNDKKFYALNPSNGTVKWQAELSAQIHSSAVISSDGTIYAASDDGSLSAFGE